MLEKLPHLSKKYHHYRFLIYLIALIALLLVLPLLRDRSALSIALTDVLCILTFTAGIYSISESKRLYHIGLVLGGLWVVSGISYTAFHFADFFGFSMSSRYGVVEFGSLFFLFTTGTTLYHVFRQRTITPDTLFGAACVYLLIGTCWSTFYLIIDSWEPGVSFSGNSLPADQIISALELNYFSYVTLTTLGYGDIVPVSSLARTVAMLEAMTGQLYVAILVARLVGVYTAQQRWERGNE